jgi:hypothetical protein
VKAVAANFEQWLQASFDHVARKTIKEPARSDWYWEEGFDSFWEPLGVTDAAAVKYLTELLLEPEHLKPYSLEQVAQGIWFLIGGSAPSKTSRALLESAVSLEERVACIHAMAEFFRKFVAPATPGPADPDTEEPFPVACFMWWDMLPLRPFRGRPLKGEPELHDACVNTMTEILGLHSDLCRIAALHGLNHWQEHYPRQVEAAIDAFLQAIPAIAPRIRQYAEDARHGVCRGVIRCTEKVQHPLPSVSVGADERAEREQGVYSASWRGDSGLYLWRDP